MVLQIMQQTHDIDLKARKAASDFRSKKLAVCTKQYPEIGSLPVPIQKLIAPELEAVGERIAQGKPIPEFEEDLLCTCRFARKYRLPCRHIFHLDGEEKVLTPEKWEQFNAMFEDCGFEVYESMGWIEVGEEIKATPDSCRIGSVLQLRELEERLRQQLYVVHEMMEEEQLHPDERQTVVDEWMDHVRASVEPLTNVMPEDIVKRTRPWEL